ncbi:cation-translocating P-type ATPase [Cellulomonas sp. KRMCY2]|uniref:cation-translocating P-type ATPase n=1 Tax=Cellulomonas sp. KRMCY2 TaxID=1304865 RepID=UPI0004B07935
MSVPLPIVDASVVEVEEVVTLLGTDPLRGLTGDEAARRLTEHGPNELTAEPSVPLWLRLLAQLRDPLIYLLLGAVVISVVAWVAEGAEGLPFDAMVIGVIVAANAVLGFVQERRAESAVAALQQMSAPTASVVRDGEVRRVPTREVVPGDLLALAEGDTVTADARLVATAALTIAEASLTGESEAVAKSPAVLPTPVGLGDRTDMVFGGTAVTRGTGRAVVVATGMGTQTGRIAQLLEATEAEQTPLQREIARVGRTLGIAVVVIATVVVGTVLLTSDLHRVSDVVTVLLLGVSLAVAAVPEGLPAILSVVLSIGVQRMAARNAIVTSLSSVETLGSASVICSDKTGTLTQNEMTVQRIMTASGSVRVAGAGYDPIGAVTVGDGDDVLDPDDPRWAEVVAVLGGGSLANDASLRQDPGGDWGIEGDPTEAAFLVAERKLGITDRRTQRFRRVGEVPFSSERKLMSTIEVDADQGGRVVVVTKGAPDVLLERCTHVLVGGEVVPLDEEHRARVLAGIAELSDDALRTLGVAYRETDADVAWAQQPDLAGAPEEVEHDLVLAGVVGIIDPPRSEARDAVAAAHRAGVRVMMITGDHPLTASRIAGDLGIVEPGAPALTGLELEALDDAGLRQAVRDVSVFARVAPEHKLRIVDALQADGNVVAMTGDGVNDAPALKSADIGVAMGITGTEVTRQAAAMILADDNFATIVDAVREGRGIFDNIKKFLRYLLSSNMGEVLTVFVGVVAAGALGLTGHGETVVVPLLATQILWINLLTDSAPALAMGVDPQTDDVMARPPRRLTDRVIDVHMWVGVLLLGAVMAVVTLLTIDLYLPGGMLPGSDDLDTARTAGFTVLVLAQLFNALNARSEATSAFRRLFANRWLWAAIVLSLALQVAVVHVPVLNTAFGTAPLGLDQWLVCAAMASAVLWVEELRKVGLRAWGRRRSD